jgi:hypothetical protein
VALVFIAIMTLITLINLIGITESVVVNVIMTFIELSGLVIVIIIGVIALVEGVNEPGVLLQFTAEGSPVIAVLAGVSLAFFAMTGFENAANVAEETIDPARAFPRALIGGMLTAGVVYVLVSISAALAMPIETLAGNTLLEVIRADLVFIPASIMIVIFGLIAMIAISNTTLVTVVFLLFIYALVIVACLKLRARTRARTPTGLTPRCCSWGSSGTWPSWPTPSSTIRRRSTGWPACWPSDWCCTFSNGSSARSSYDRRAPSVTIPRRPTRPG